MELMLMREDLWSTVKDPKPESANVTSVWTRKDEKARAMIGLALEDSQLTHILDAVSANEMWEMLKGYHERGSLSNKVHALRRLCSMRLGEGENMSKHLVEAAELVHRLARMGESLKEHLVVAILLSSLPESYNPLVTALEGRPEEDVKLEYVKGKLLDEWRRRSEKRKQENAQEEVKKCSVLPEKRSIRKCYYCGKDGHIQCYCPNLLRKIAEVKKKEDEAKSLAVQHPEAGSSSRGACFTVKTASDVPVNQKWIIDSGSSRHMTNTTACLSWWNPCVENIALADGRTLTARGSGQGRIVGRGLEAESVEIKLKELLFVPGLSVNVLSVSRMTDAGYYVQFGPKDCRIMNAETVIAVGVKKEGLYYLV